MDMLISDPLSSIAMKFQALRNSSPSVSVEAVLKHCSVGVEFDIE